MTNIKWSYMDHYSMPGPRGNTSPYASRALADEFVRTISGLGFQGFDSFARYLPGRAAMFGSVKNYLDFLKERGMEKIVGVFHEYSYVSPTRAPHVRATHDNIFRDVENIMRINDAGWGWEMMITMPASTYWQVEPVTDEKLRAMADIWNRVGKLTIANGIKTACHHEFWCGLKTVDEMEKFYNWTDPQYVYYYCDTAQHQLAGNDPVKLYMKYHDRCCGFHLKDTHVQDTTEDFRMPPDPEAQAPHHTRWFWPMGEPAIPPYGPGLVDFPALFKALKDYNYKGWVSVEHDGTSDYPESTCTAAWYIDNVLKKIYS